MSKTQAVLQRDFTLDDAEVRGQILPVSAIGKTVKEIRSGDVNNRSLLIFFTDGTFLFLLSSDNQIESMVTVHDAAEAERELRRIQYIRLKAEFEK